jgi:hypothetical protein
MRSLRLTAAAALLAAVLGAGVAHADAPWSAPVTIGAGIDGFFAAGLAFTGDGHALVTFGGYGARTPTHILAADPGASAFTEIGTATLVSPPAPYGGRGLALLRTPSPIRDRAKVARLGASLGTVARSVGRFQQLARVDISRSGAISAQIAADARGNVAAVWLEPRPGRAPAGLSEVVRVALRRPGHAFGRARTLGHAIEYSEGGNLLDAAYGANGDLIVTFQRTRSRLVSEGTLELAARVKRRGHRFGPIQSLGPSRGSSSIATAVAGSGRAVVAWGTQDGGEGVERPWTVRAAVLRSGAARFSKRQLLDPGRVGRPVAGVSAAIARDGTATVAWSGVAPRRLPYPVRVATARPAGRFGAPTELAPQGAASGVVTARDGTTTVLWGSLTDAEAETLDQIFASGRPPGAGNFAPAEAVSPRESVFDSAALALDPRSGRPAALWIGSPTTPPGQLPGGGRPAEPRYSVRGG